MLCTIDICDKQGCLVDHREQISLNYKLMLLLLPVMSILYVRRENVSPLRGGTDFVGINIVMQGLLCWSGLEVVRIEMVLFLKI